MSNSNVQEMPSHIPWDENLELSHEDFVNNINLDNIDNETLFGKPPFLSPEEMAILAEAAYKNVSEQEQLKLPEGWKFLTAAYNNSEKNHYFGVAFWNATQHQVVVAHRGTRLSIQNIYRSWSTVYTDLKGIYNAEYVPQINSAVTFAEKIRETFKDKPVRVNFTGHSLGGWLAQITTFSVKYLRPQQGRGGMMHFVLDPKCVEQCHAHTVVFEAPGCKQMLDKIKTQLAPARDECKNYEKRLDITVYLTLTNWINTTNTHLGTILVFKEDLFHEHSRSISPIRAHSISSIVDAFKRRSNHSELIQEVHEFLDNRPYTTHDYESTICPLSRFSVDELYFLISMESLQTRRENAVSQNKLQILDRLPEISLDSYHYRLVSKTEEDLNTIVKVTKQGMLTLRHVFLQHINEHNFKQMYPNLQFFDNFGLVDFLNNKDDHLLQIVTDSKDSIMSAIHSILTFNSLYNSSDKHHTALYLSWENFNKLIKLMDLSTIINMSGLVVIESKPSRFVQDIISYIQKNKMQKCILIDLSREQFSEIPRSKEILSEFLQLKTNSQHELLKERLSQNRTHISAMDVLYQNEEVYLHNVPKYLQTEEDTKFFITCSIEDEKDIQEFQGAVKNRITTINNSNKEDSEQLRDFKKFCQQNFENQLIWLEIVAKNNVRDKTCICRCIYDSNLCIPRQLSNKRFINKDSVKAALLSNELKDMCIIIDEVNNETAFLQDLSKLENVSIVRSMSEADNISKSSESLCHILTFTPSQELEWKHSNKSLHNIKCYVQPDFTPEDEFIEQKRKTVIIEGAPGIGKTTLCKKLLHKLGNSATIYFDLKNCAKNIGDLSTNLNLEKVIKFLLKHVDGKKSELDISLLRKAFKENLGNSTISTTLTLLFDGFDELPREGPSGHDLHSKLLSMLQFLSLETTAVVWITTTNCYLNMLEEKLLVFGTKFQEISEPIQTKYVNIYWQTLLKLQTMSHQESEENIAYTNEGTFATDIEDMKLKHNNCTKSDEPVIVCEEFVKEQFKNYIRSKTELDDSMEDDQLIIWTLEEVLNDRLQNLAFYNCFKEEANLFLEEKEQNDACETLNTFEGLEFISQNNLDNSIELKPALLQEYFCARKIFKWIMNKSHPFDFPKFLLTKVLSGSNYTYLRGFLNDLLRTNAGKAYKKLFHINTLKLTKDKLMIDDLGSCFSVSARENHKNLTQFLFDAVAEIVKQVLHRNARTSIEIPLLMRMLLEVVKPKCADSCSKDTNVFIPLNIASLYNEFVDLKFTIYFEQEHTNPLTGTQKDVFIDKLCWELENLAFYNHFEEETKEILTEEETLFKHLNACLCLGLVQQTDVTSGSAEFIHITFQEYFVAKKLFRLITNKCSFAVIELLITKVLLQDSYKIIRLFLNHQLQTFIIKTDSTKLTLNNMWNEDRYRLFDAQGNSCFSTLAGENHENLMKFLIIAFGECAVKMLTMQNKNKQTPLAIAIEKENIKLVRMIKKALNVKHQNEVIQERHLLWWIKHSRSLNAMK